MGGITDFLFGGSDDSAQRAQTSANRQALELFEQLSQQARGDVLGLLPAADINRNLGIQAALDVFGQGTGQQLGAFQQGNVGAQTALLGGFQPFQSAILGGPVDLSGLQPQQIAFDPSFLQQTLPQFTPSVSPEQAGLNQLAALLGGTAQIGQGPTAGQGGGVAGFFQNILGGAGPGDVQGTGGDPNVGAGVAQDPATMSNAEIAAEIAQLSDPVTAALQAIAPGPFAGLFGRSRKSNLEAQLEANIAGTAPGDESFGLDATTFSGGGGDPGAAPGPGDPGGGSPTGGDVAGTPF